MAVQQLDPQTSGARFLAPEAPVGNPTPEPEPSGALLTGMPAAVFAEMLRVPLQRRISRASGIHPDNAAELWAAFHELDHAGKAWMALRPRKSAGSVTEMHPASSLDMEISPKKAGELLRLTDSRIRQLLRSNELPGRRVGRRWVVKRSAVAAYAGTSRKAAA